MEGKEREKVVSLPEIEVWHVHLEQRKFFKFFEVLVSFFRRTYLGRKEGLRVADVS